MSSVNIMVITLYTSGVRETWTLLQMDKSAVVLALTRVRPAELTANPFPIPPTRSSSRQNTTGNTPQRSKRLLFRICIYIFGYSRVCVYVKQRPSSPPHSAQSCSPPNNSHLQHDQATNQPTNQPSPSTPLYNLDKMREKPMQSVS